MIRINLGITPSPCGPIGVTEALGAPSPPGLMGVAQQWVRGWGLWEEVQTDSPGMVKVKVATHTAQGTGGSSQPRESALR